MGNLPFEILQWTLALAGVWLVSGTLINFSSHPHRYIRGWDFPRVLAAALAPIVAAAWAWTCDWQWWDWVFLASLAGVVRIQVWNNYPYTPLARQQVLRTERMEDRPTSIRLVATNVLTDRNQDSTPRDAELVLVGRAIGDDPADPPTIVTGDLNDVAWSHTTRLFLPARQEEQPEPEEDASDRAQADEMLEAQAQEEAARSRRINRASDRQVDAVTCRGE